MGVYRANRYRVLFAVLPVVVRFWAFVVCLWRTANRLFPVVSIAKRSEQMSQQGEDRSRQDTKLLLHHSNGSDRSLCDAMGHADQQLALTFRRSVVGPATAVSRFSTADSRFVSIVCRTRMVSTRDMVVNYTGLGLLRVIPYV
jgi:hypothetical protein